MIEKIYTIPVNESYESDCECPLCTLKAKAETDYLDYYLGPSLMEPDTRVQTNRTGFCPEHMGKLNTSEKSRLGLGLMLHTHLKDFDEDITDDLRTAAPNKGSFFKGRNTEYKSKLISIADKIDKRVSLCPICEKIEYTTGRYVEVIMYLYSHDPDFRTKFDNKTHCLPHTSLLLRSAAAKLSQNDAADFIVSISRSNTAAFKTLEDDVEWFTLKFDYRNNDKPWGNSKNAIQRSMRFLSGNRGDFDERQSKK